MAGVEHDPTIEVAVVCSPVCGTAIEVRVSLASPGTVIDAIRASGFLDRFAEIDLAVQSVGVWGRPTSLDAGLRPNDRIEIYRPLAVNPKEARRQRVAGHKAVTRR